MAENILTLTDSNFQSEVLDSAAPVLVDFWAPWCMPCRQLSPTIEAVATEFEGRVRVGKMNTDENQKTPSTYRISGIPTVMLFKGGQLVEKVVGLVPKAKLTELLKSHL